MTPAEKILREGMERISALELTEDGRAQTPQHYRKIARETLTKADEGGDGWIAVTERLPEPGVEVLVEINGHRGPSWRNNYNQVAYLTKGGCWIAEREKGWNPLFVTHWQPLPEPPK